MDEREKLITKLLKAAAEQERSNKELEMMLKLTKKELECLRSEDRQALTALRNQITVLQDKV